MAHRILILAGDRVLTGIDGHDGRSHAEALVAACIQEEVRRGRLASADDAVVLELLPQQGAGEVAAGTLHQLHRLRAQFHVLPDGSRELVGIYRMPPHGIVRAVNPVLREGDTPPDTPEQAQRKLKRQRAAIPDDVRGQWRVLSAPADVAGPRRELSHGSRRLETPAASAASTDRGARLARRLAKASTRP